ncbi:hypothetical protein DBR06_SOUSAS3710002, partial [Sousa chinensis]
MPVGRHLSLANVIKGSSNQGQYVSQEEGIRDWGPIWPYQLALCWILTDCSLSTLQTGELCPPTGVGGD